MPTLTHLGRVLVPVADQDEAIAFYTTALGFSLTADDPFGEGDRWVEVTPPGGGAAIALVPPQGGYEPGRMTGIALGSEDRRPTTPSSPGGVWTWTTSSSAARAGSRACSSSGTTTGTP